MRIILKRLMDEAGDKPHDIHRKTGVQASTIYKFLKGDHRDPTSTTVQKLAMLYGITESQLRGDTPIEGAVTPVQTHELKQLLTIDEYNHVYNMKNLNRETRGILFRLAEILGDESPTAETEKRTHSTIPNNQLRIGEHHHQDTPKKHIHEFEEKQRHTKDKAAQRA